MRLAIMQPYFLPYIGYFQLIAAVDQFVVYDNIKYTKKGWINRNRMLLNGSDSVFSLPLKKDSDSLDVAQRQLAENFDRTKLLNQFNGAYGRTPYFHQTFSLLERIVRYEDTNLFRYIYHSQLSLCEHLDIKTKIRPSSEVAINHNLKSQGKVQALCQAVGADVYVNSIGGIELYAKDSFLANGIELKFLKPKQLEYPQLGAPFVPWLSIIDVLMFNPIDMVQQYVKTNYELI